MKANDILVRELIDTHGFDGDFVQSDDNGHFIGYQDGEPYFASLFGPRQTEWQITKAHVGDTFIDADGDEWMVQGVMSDADLKWRKGMDA